MVMGERGMHDMGEMEMPIPDNTLPMMTGQGPFGGVAMGGMFTVLKVRKRPEARATTRDPGWYKHPAGTVAYEWKGATPAPAQQVIGRKADGTREKTGEAKTGRTEALAAR